ASAAGAIRIVRTSRKDLSMGFPGWRRSREMVTDAGGGPHAGPEPSGHVRRAAAPGGGSDLHLRTQLHHAVRRDAEIARGILRVLRHEREQHATPTLHRKPALPAHQDGLAA